MPWPLLHLAPHCRGTSANKVPIECGTIGKPLVLRTIFVIRFQIINVSTDNGSAPPYALSPNNGHSILRPMMPVPIGQLERSTRIMNLICTATRPHDKRRDTITFLSHLPLVHFTIRSIIQYIYVSAAGVGIMKIS
jgi:hypothetical protein